MKLKEILQKNLINPMGKRIDRAIGKSNLTNYQIENRNSDIIGNIRKCQALEKNPNFLNPKTIKTLTLGNKRIKRPLFENKEVLIFGKIKEERILARNLFIDSIYFLLDNSEIKSKENNRKEYKNFITLIENKSKYKELALNCLIDYYPFAKIHGYNLPYNSEKEKAKEKNNKIAREKFLLKLLYPHYTSDNAIQNNYKYILKEAIQYIYLKSFADPKTFYESKLYFKKFKTFIKDNITITKINKYLIADYIINILIPILDINIEYNNKIGHRTYEIIKNDIHLLPFIKMMSKDTEEQSIWIDLISSDIKYINDLEKVFESYIEYITK